MQPYTKKSAEIDVLILSGGQGTRLKEVVSDRPKTMAEVNQRPFLDILIDYTSSFGFRRFIICTGYKSAIIKNYYADYTGPRQILISDETTPLDTGGAVKNAEKLIQSASFLVMNGDSFCPVDLSGFAGFHAEKDAMISMVVVEAEDARDYGLIRLDDSQKIIRFAEKSGDAKALINAGIYLFKKEVLAALPHNTKYSLEYDLFPKLAGKELYGYISTAQMIDIGTPERLAQAKKSLSER